MIPPELLAVGVIVVVVVWGKLERDCRDRAPRGKRGIKEAAK